MTNHAQIAPAAPSFPNLIELEQLHCFCESLPEPIIAQPIITPIPNRGLKLSLQYLEHRVTIIENGNTCLFCSVDAVLLELDGVPFIDKSHIIIETANWHP